MSRGSLRIRIVGDASHLQRTLGSATSSIGRFATRGLAALGAAAVATAGASIRAFANFDQAMTNSTAIMGDLSDAMRRDMADAAREIGRTTRFSATEAAESYFFLASAGMDAAQSIEALPRVAAFAQAGNFDMARATDLLTDAQSALGMVVDDNAESLENLARVGDVLVKANTLANASVEQFSEALTQKAGSALRQLNKDVEEGVAVLAVYADQGRKGGEAGTQLNAVLEGLVRTSRTNAKDWEKLGVAVFDSSGEMRNMGDIVGDLEQALDGMSTEQQFAELSSLGLTRQALDGTLALLGNADAIREYEKQLRSAGGVTDEVADRQMQTFWAQLGLVKDQIVDVGLSIGEALMPALMGFAEWLQAKLPDITAWFRNVSDRFNELLGVTQETTAGSTAAMDGWAARHETSMGQVASQLNDMGIPYHLWEDMVGKTTADAALHVAKFRRDTGDEFSEAEGFLGRMWEAWKTVWHEQIAPWFMDTVLPWLDNVFFPAVIDAFGRAGAAAARAFWDGVTATVPRALRGWGMAIDVAGVKLSDRTGLPRPPMVTDLSSSSAGRSAGGTLGSIPRFDHGGIVPGPRGREVLIKAHAGETVVPTHKQGWKVAGADRHETARRGTTYNVYAPTTSAEDIIAVARRDEWTRARTSGV